MTTVTLATFCHPPHLPKLHAPGVLDEMISSHRYPFDEVIVVHQRCRGLEYRPFDWPGVRIVESESHPNILTEFGLPEDDPFADELTHGPTAPHYWKWHCINHLIALKEAKSDYIVFSDCDCLIIGSDPVKSWVEEAMEILEVYPQVLIVGPSDGGSMAEAWLDGGRARLTQNVSQQLFIAERERLKKIDFNVPWHWEKLAPGGPFQEYYFLMEGRIWRYLDREGLWRAVLPDRWRYWHYNPWEPRGWVEAGRPM
jgi:hypothetical protein